MAREKSCYRFVFNCDPAIVKRIIDDYLRANNFKFKQKNYGSFYQASNRFLEYYFSGNMVMIYAYINSYKHPYPLDDSFTGVIPKQAYKEALIPLFSALDQLGAPQNNPYMMQNGYQQMNGMPVNGDPMNPMAMAGQPGSPALQRFSAENTKQKDTMAIVSFIISIFGLGLAFVGYVYGLWILAIEIYMAIIGLKSNKKGLAIAALCLCGSSIVILVIQILYILQ